MLMCSSSIIASLLLTVWWTASPYTVLSIEAKQPTQIRSHGESTTFISTPFTLSNSRRLDQASTASVQQNRMENIGSAVPDITFQDDGRSRGIERHKKDANATATTAVPSPNPAKKTKTTLGITTQSPTKPPRRKSRAPTPSPISSPIDDDIVGDDVAPAASPAADSADTESPIPLIVPSPIPVQPVSPTMAPTSHTITISPVSIPVNTPMYPKTRSVQPSAAYVPIDDDPILTQQMNDKEGKEEVELEHVQTEAKTAGSIGFLLALCGMIFTAHQVSENPDGIYASVCRLAITIVGCAFKLILMPCRNFMGNRYHAGHIPVSTMEYREPYRGGNSAMEMT